MVYTIKNDMPLNEIYMAKFMNRNSSCLVSTEIEKVND